MERQSGWYWILIDEDGSWTICEYDANWGQWRLNGKWGYLDEDFFNIDERRLIRNASTKTENQNI